VFSKLQTKTEVKNRGFRSEAVKDREKAALLVR
jgi:hypothetical protein